MDDERWMRECAFEGAREFLLKIPAKDRMVYTIHTLQPHIALKIQDINIIQDLQINHYKSIHSATHTCAYTYSLALVGEIKNRRVNIIRSIKIYGLN